MRKIFHFFLSHSFNLIFLHFQLVDRSLSEFLGLRFLFRSILGLATLFKVSRCIKGQKTVCLIEINRQLPVSSKSRYSITDYWVYLGNATRYSMHRHQQ